jgi:hypothetical protein
MDALPPTSASKTVPHAISAISEHRMMLIYSIFSFPQTVVNGFGAFFYGRSAPVQRVLIEHVLTLLEGERCPYINPDVGVMVGLP